MNPLRMIDISRYAIHSEKPEVKHSIHAKLALFINLIANKCLSLQAKNIFTVLACDMTTYNWLCNNDNNNNNRTLLTEDPTNKNDSPVMDFAPPVADPEFTQTELECIQLATEHFFSQRGGNYYVIVQYIMSLLYKKFYDHFELMAIMGELLEEINNACHPSSSSSSYIL
jgi:hypothetical protein